jgi:CitMHS family citrate-Mg2+:H+ or citrate-Ca2+:H+ symporter
MVFWGFLIIGALLGLILTRKLSALASLILVPVVGSLLAGFGSRTFAFAVEGIRDIAPVVAMFVFAILFFGILRNAGMFDPLIEAILGRVGHDPVWIAMGTAVLAMVVHLDGSGATTFLIAVPALLPLYERLGLDRRVLACVVSLGAGIMNMMPWGGPTLRAASALEVDVAAVYRPLVLPQLAGILFVLGISAWLGRREGRRLAAGEGSMAPPAEPLGRVRGTASLPPRFGWNVALAVVTVASLVAGLMAPAMVFMLATTVALLLNHPDPSEQRRQIVEHSEAAILMTGILLAAGVFTGILRESGMIDAMATAVVTVVPPGAGGHLPLIVAVLSMPLSLVFDPNSFYFGVLPVLAGTGMEFGIEPTTMAHAALMGQMTTGFPLSPLTAATFLLIGLAKVDLADHQRFTFGYALAATLVMTFVAVVAGVIPV